VGLDASGAVSEKSYHAGYGSLHLVRWLALVDCGFPETIGSRPSVRYYPGWYIVPEGLTAKDIQAMVESSMLAGYWYKNLLLHSDCEGTYTKRGKVDTKSFLTGNSVELLGELELLKKGTPDRLKTGRPWEVFTMLYEMVKDEVKNGKGIIKFH
jgi:hypothetical protein